VRGYVIVTKVKSYSVAGEDSKVPLSQCQGTSSRSINIHEQ
jgi:hypothetical protein